MFLDMKKYFILLAAALLAVACNQEELQDPEGNAVEIPSNGFLAGIETKVSLESDFSLSWEEGDQVAIWNGTELLAPYTAQTAGKTTVLLGEEVNTDLAHCAFYPYDAVVEFEGNTVTAVIPGQQTPKSGTFPFNPSVAYAAAGEQTLQFYNVCGLVGFEITEAEQGVNNVVIFGNNDEDLTGTVNVSYDEISAPKATVVKGVKSVTLQATETFAPGTYYVAILPQEYKDGITITMNTPDGKQYKKNSKPFTLRRSHRINAMNINDGEFGAENLISNAAELQAFFNIVNADENKGAGMVGKIVDDIDLSHIDNFTPAAEFAGTLDGAYTVGEETRNYSISNTTSHLIGTLSATGVVKNINVSGNLTINANDDAAFIVLDNAGTISYCKTQGKAETSSDLVFEKERAVGAIAARTSGTIEYCTNEAAINLNPKSTAKWAAATLAAHQFVGGIAGQATGTDGSAKITNCTNSGTVTYQATNGYISSMACVGGILGGTPSVLYPKVAEWVPVNNVAISSCVNTKTATVTYGYKNNANGNAYNNLNLGGVAGYLEGVISNSSNAALIKVDGYRTTDDHSGDHYLKNVSVAGVVGVVTGNVTSCVNSGKIDFSATISSGDAAAPFIGSTAYSVVAGIVAKTFKSTLSDCENSGELVIDMHMRQANGSAGVIGGVVGYAYTTAFKNCINKGACTWTTRPKNQFLGGVCGLYQNVTTIPEKLQNYGDIKVDAGLIAKSVGRQSQIICLGGVFGKLESNSLDIKDKEAFYNEGDIEFKGGSNTSSNTNDKDFTKYIGGVCGWVLNARPRGSETHKFINRGSITVTEVPSSCYVAGVHAYQSGLSASTDGVGAHNSENHGDITVSTGGKLSVGGVFGYYGARCMYNGTNTGDIVITNTGGNVRVGGVIGDCAAGLRSNNMLNQGDVTVTKSGTGYVCAAGVHAAEGGRLGNPADAATAHVNEGEITLISSVKDSYLGGISAYDKAEGINGANKGNLTFTYNGDGTNTPVLYASFVAAHHHGSANYKLTEVSGTLTLNNVDKVKCHCGALAGYMNASGAIKTTETYTVAIKKSAAVNGVSASLDDSFLVGTNDGGTLTKGYVSLID